MARVIDTDNFGGDYPDEKFVTEIVTQLEAETFANTHNTIGGINSPRYYKVVEDDYVLVPGFQP